MPDPRQPDVRSGVRPDSRTDPQPGRVQLDQIGIHVADDDEDPGVRAECARIARHLLANGTRVVGLLPATRDTAVPPLAVQLGLSLVELSGATVAVVDANVHWPALSRLVELSPQRADDEAFFATRWLRDSLALLTPPQAGEAGAGLPELARLIEHGRDLFAFMIADLTGFDLLGEHLGAMDLMQGVLVVAPAGKIKEDQLLRWNQEVPSNRRLGVLLVGPGAPR
jgi:hypothetical protein